MSTATSTRALLLAAVIALGQAVDRAADWYFAPMPAAPPEQDLAELPRQLGGWQGDDEPLSSGVLVALGADAVVNRDYRNQLGETIGVNVAVFTDYSLSPPHPPFVCYPANGWELQSTRMVAFDRAGSGQVEVPVYAFRKQGEQVMVAFWMQMGDELAFDRDDLRRIQRRLRQSHTPLRLLKKVMLQTRLDTEERSEVRLLSLARPLFEAVDAYK
jgi:EpsI family protein